MSTERGVYNPPSRVSRESIDKADSRFMPVVNNKREKRKGEGEKREEREKKIREENERGKRRGLKSTLEV